MAHIFKFENYSKRFRVTTSATHKKKHTEMHQTRQSKAFHEWDREMKLRYVTILIATCGLPFKVVESPIFRLITGSNFSRKIIKETVKDQYCQKKQLIRYKLNSIEAISITTDIWSCSVKNNESYSCYIGH